MTYRVTVYRTENAPHSEFFDVIETVLDERKFKSRDAAVRFAERQNKKPGVHCELRNW